MLETAGYNDAISQLKGLPMKRRDFLKLTSGTIAGTMLAPHLLASAAERNGAFVHPGILHTSKDIQRMRAGIAAGEAPFVAGLRVLQDNPSTDPNWNPRPLERVVRGGEGNNVATMFIDIHRAYQCALVWLVTGSEPHGEAACRILNAWTARLRILTGNADRFLAAGLHGFQFAAVAEMMRVHPKFDMEAMKRMLARVFFALNQDFLFGTPDGSRANHNFACITNYWANWDLCNIASVIAIGVFCDDKEMFELGIEYFKHGGGNGAIYNAIPFIHPCGLGQWQEAGRDQGHTVMCIGQMANICETAWNQGIDLYGWADNRFLRGAEYVARYNNGHDVPFELYEWGHGQNCERRWQDVVSPAGRGHLRPVWEAPYNHYVQRKGLTAPNIAEMLIKTRPEGGPRPGMHAGSFDQLGFGTLTFTRPKGGGDDAQLPPGNIADGQYRFVSRMNGKALQPLANASGKTIPVVVAAKNDDMSQVWNVRHLIGGQYEITNAQSGMSLAIESNALNMGANVVAVADRTKEGLIFAFHPTELVDTDKKLLRKHDFHYIRSGNSRNVLDIKDSYQADSAPVIQWRYLVSSNQQWILESVAQK